MTLHAALDVLPLGEDFPGSHAVHVVAPSISENIPFAHGEHVLASMAENVPFEHGKQLVFQVTPT